MVPGEGGREDVECRHGGEEGQRLNPGLRHYITEVWRESKGDREGTISGWKEDHEGLASCSQVRTHGKEMGVTCFFKCSESRWAGAGTLELAARGSRVTPTRVTWVCGRDKEQVGVGVRQTGRGGFGRASMATLPRTSSPKTLSLSIVNLASGLAHHIHPTQRDSSDADGGVCDSLYNTVAWISGDTGLEL